MECPVCKGSGKICSPTKIPKNDIKAAWLMAKNSMWTLHWYPNTPIGFTSLSASSIPALFAALKKAQ